jgi:cell fate regulator YaaT (PSP1 superfamily)
MHVLTFTLTRAAYVVFLLCYQTREEAQVLSSCRAKVKARGLPMTVFDAEFQFDHNKLTFFYQADK